MNRFHWRRIPGTLALAATNLVAAGVILDPDTMSSAPIHRINVGIMPAQAWGALWLVAGVGLLVAAATRLYAVLHVAGALSLAIWTGVVTGSLVAVVKDDLSTTAVGMALLVWVFGGTASMILAPLWARGRGADQ